MPAPKGNQYWMLGNVGRKTIFKDSNELWDKCVGYFEWVVENPLLEEKLFHASGQITRATVSKMRAMTQNGLCLYLGIGEQTWRDYREREAFSEVTERVDHIIKEQKFTGAAADLLNPVIIARDLGLSEKIDQQSTMNVSISNEDAKTL